MPRERIGSIRECEICGRERYWEPNQLRNGEGRFCSRACKDKAPPRLVDMGDMGIRPGRDNPEADRAWKLEHARRWRQAWRLANPGKRASWTPTSAYKAEWRQRQKAKDPERLRRVERAIRIKSKYGITIEQYEAIEAAQGGVCAVCGRAETMKIRGTVCMLAVDHDHSCCPGKKSCGQCVRGLLCVTCNMLIGGARHDPAILEAAIGYLTR